MAGNYMGENFGKIKISQDPTSRFEFPFVQPQFRSCSFGWWSGELPENSSSKVWAGSRSAMWWWKFEKMMHAIYVTYITKYMQFTLHAFRQNWEKRRFGFLRAISGGFGTLKSTGVLRCAQCSEFWRSHVQCHCCIGSWMVSTWIMNMACRDGIPQTGV